MTLPVKNNNIPACTKFMSLLQICTEVNLYKVVKFELYKQKSKSPLTTLLRVSTKASSDVDV